MKSLIVINTAGNLDPTTQSNLETLKKSYEKKLALPQKLANVFKKAFETYIHGFTEELKKYKKQLSEADYSVLVFWETEFTKLANKFA